MTWPGAKATQLLAGQPKPSFLVAEEAQPSPLPRSTVRPPHFMPAAAAGSWQHPFLQPGKQLLLSSQAGAIWKKNLECWGAAARMPSPGATGAGVDQETPRDPCTNGSVSKGPRVFLGPLGKACTGWCGEQAPNTCLQKGGSDL